METTQRRTRTYEEEKGGNKLEESEKRERVKREIKADWVEKLISMANVK